MIFQGYEPKSVSRYYIEEEEALFVTYTVQHREILLFAHQAIWNLGSMYRVSPVTESLQPKAQQWQLGSAVALTPNLLISNPQPQPLSHHCRQ